MKLIRSRLCCRRRSHRASVDNAAAVQNETRVPIPEHFKTSYDVKRPSIQVANKSLQCTPGRTEIDEG